MVACKSNREFDQVWEWRSPTPSGARRRYKFPAQRPLGRLRRRFRLIIGRNVLGAGDVFCEPHPRLRQCQPKRLIVLVIRSARHGHAFFRKPPMVSTSMIVNDPHHEIPD